MMKRYSGSSETQAKYQKGEGKISEGTDEGKKEKELEEEKKKRRTKYTIERLLLNIFSR